MGHVGQRRLLGPFLVAPIGFGAMRLTGPNVFGPPRDRREAIRDAYELDGLPSEQEVLAIAEKWRPFRSLATSYLFASAFDRHDVEA